MKITKILKLNDERKVFLIAWIPIITIVLLALLGNIGQHYDGYILNEKGVRIHFEGYKTFDDVFPYLIVVLILSFVLYIIVGLEDLGEIEKNVKKHKVENKT